MSTKNHSVSQLQSQRQKSGEYHAKIHDKVTTRLQQAEQRADQSKWGFEQDLKPRAERREEQRQEQRATKKWLKAQQRAQHSATSETQAIPATKIELNHKQKLHAAGKQRYREHKEEKMQQDTQFWRNVITFAATAQLISMVILPAAAQMNTHSLNSRSNRPNAPRAKSLGGTNATQTRVFDVANLDGNNGYRLSPQANFSGNLTARAGESVAVIKSATGYGNVLVGSPGENNYYRNIGRADMVYSSNQTHSAEVPLYNHSDNTGARFDGQAYGIGQNVKDIGDFDGDGNVDFLVTARHDAAAALDIVYGTEDGTYPDGLNLDTATPDQVLHVMQTDPRSSNGSPVYLETSAATVGDANQDGKADVLFPGCADPEDTRDVRDNNNLCLLYGSDEYRKKDIGTVDLSTVLFDGKQTTLIYPTETSYSGYQPLTTVRALGDVTKDGLDDFAVANPSAFIGKHSDCEPPEGKVSVFKSQEGGFPGAIKKTTQYLQEGGGFTFFGAKPGSETGKGVTSGFDYNQDGNLDMGIGVPGMEEVQIVYGPLTADRFPGPQTSLGNLTSEQGVTVKGECAGDGTGFALTSAGNFYNNDTHGGLLIGTFSGAKAFILSSTANPSAEVKLGLLSEEEGVKIIDSKGSATFGYAVASGWVNGDETTDLVVGDPTVYAGGFDGGGPGRGATVVLGSGSLPTEASHSQCPSVVPTPLLLPLCPTPTPIATPIPTHTKPTPAPAPIQQQDEQGSAWKKAGIALGSVAGFMFLTAAGYGLARRHEQHSNGYDEITTPGASRRGSPVNS